MLAGNGSPERKRRERFGRKLGSYRGRGLSKPFVPRVLLGILPLLGARAHHGAVLRV